MLNRFRLQAAVALTSLTLAGAACGRGDNKNLGTSTTPAAPAAVTPAPTTTTPAPVTAAPAAAATPEHHSKLGGAVAGAVAGRVIGGSKKGALVGAAAGAYIQHRRNKAAREAAGAATP